jgi:hypothetical protein
MIEALRGASLLAMILPLAMGTAQASETITYTYDVYGRLVAVQNSGTVNNGQNVSVAYDAAGNRTNYTVTGAGPATPTLTIGNASVTEGGNLAFPVTLSPSATGTVTVNYASANGTAVAPGDYTATSNTLTFTAGQTSKTITIATIDDSTVESSEAMSVTLSGATGGAAIGTATGTGTIDDNDTVSPANLAIGSASVTEGGTLSFTVTRSGNTGIAASASYATSSGTATSGSDFTAATGTVSFAASETTKTITVATTDDSTVESAETMTVTLSSPGSNTTITTATSTGTINDNDVTPATLAIGNASVLEGGTLSFTVTRSGNTAIAASASYATSSGTATSGSDFTAASGTVSFAASETTKTISVATTDDSTAESAETMTVTLSSPSSNTTITTTTGTGTINDNDTYITLTDANANVLPAYQSDYWCYTYIDDSGASRYYYGETGCYATAGQVYFSWFDYPFSGPISQGETHAQGYVWSGALKVLAPYYGTAVP